MTGRDFLWCALHLLLDEEEAIEALCPTCKVQAEQGACPACGRVTVGLSVGENAAFDVRRFEQLKRGDGV